MGAYIKGMEMPHQGEFKHIRIYDNGDVTVEVDDGEAVIAHAVPVPPHGRLIDADALKLEIAGEDDGFGHDVYTAGIHDGFVLSFECIDEAPTILEAEEGE